MWITPFLKCHGNMSKNDWSNRSIIGCVLFTQMDTRTSSRAGARIWMANFITMAVPKHVHARNLEKNPNVTLHLESGNDVVIMDGTSQPASNQTLNLPNDSLKLIAQNMNLMDTRRNQINGMKAAYMFSLPVNAWRGQSSSRTRRSLFLKRRIK